jgi:hypothetical protein
VSELDPHISTTDRSQEDLAEAGEEELAEQDGTAGAGQPPAEGERGSGT